MSSPWTTSRSTSMTASSSRCSGPSGLRQDDDAAHDRRLRGAHQRPDRAPGPGRDVAAAPQAERQHGVPELRPLPAPDHLRQRRLRAAATQGGGARRSSGASRRCWSSSSCAGFDRRKPGQISGGQAQRVALARALINRPAVLLLDEPLGALDLKLRKQMQVELKRIQQEVGITFIYVTHDQEEAMTMSDRDRRHEPGPLRAAGPAGGPLRAAPRPGSWRGSWAPATCCTGAPRAPRMGTSVVRLDGGTVVRVPTTQRSPVGRALDVGRAPGEDPDARGRPSRWTCGPPTTAVRAWSAAPCTRASAPRYRVELPDGAPRHGLRAEPRARLAQRRRGSPATQVDAGLVARRHVRGRPTCVGWTPRKPESWHRRAVLPLRHRPVSPRLQRDRTEAAAPGGPDALPDPRRPLSRSPHPAAQRRRRAPPHSAAAPPRRRGRPRRHDRRTRRPHRTQAPSPPRRLPDGHLDRLHRHRRGRLRATRRSTGSRPRPGVAIDYQEAVEDNEIFFAPDLQGPHRGRRAHRLGHRACSPTG